MGFSRKLSWSVGLIGVGALALQCKAGASALGSPEVAEICANTGGSVTVTRGGGSDPVCGEGNYERRVVLTVPGIGKQPEYPLATAAGSSSRAVVGTVGPEVPSGRYLVSVLCTDKDNKDQFYSDTKETIDVPCPADGGSPDGSPDGQTDPDAGEAGGLEVTGTAYCVMNANPNVASICGGEILLPTTMQHQATLASTIAFEKARALLVGGPPVGQCGNKPFVLPPMGVVPNANAGPKITMNADGTLFFDMLRQGNGAYYATPPAPAPLGKVMTFDFVGGPDLAAKSGVGVGTAPPQFTVSGGNTIQLSSTVDTLLTWTTSASTVPTVPTFYAEFPGAGRVCHFDWKLGMGNIPASFVAQLPPSGQMIFVAGNWTEGPLGNGKAIGVSLIEQDNRSYNKQ